MILTLCHMTKCTDSLPPLLIHVVIECPHIKSQSNCKYLDFSRSNMVMLNELWNWYKNDSTGLGVNQLKSGGFSKNYYWLFTRDQCQRDDQFSVLYSRSNTKREKNLCIDVENRKSQIFSFLHNQKITIGFFPFIIIAVKVTRSQQLLAQGLFQLHILVRPMVPRGKGKFSFFEDRLSFKSVILLPSHVNSNN